MERANVDLPDFSRGETFANVSYPSFEPLFASHGHEPQTTSQDVNHDQGDLAGLSPALAELDGIVAESAGQGEEQEESMSRSQHTEILDDLARHYNDELNELTQKHREEVLQHLEGLESRFVDIVTNRIETGLTDILSKLFQDKLTETCIKRLAGEIRAVVQKSAIDHLKISGPPKLVSAFVDGLPDEGIPIEIEETDSVDLKVSFNDKNISTKISDWMVQLEEALSS